MQIPSKYIFFIKERIRESTLFLRRTTLSDNKKNTNLNNKINSYKKVVKEQNEIINKIKNKASAQNSYNKSEEIKKIIKNNEEAIEKITETIRAKILDLKKQLKNINTSIVKEKSKQKDVQKKTILLRDKIKAQETSNGVLKKKLKEKSIEAKKNKKELIIKNNINEKEGLDKQSTSPTSNKIFDKLESLNSFSEEIINTNLELNQIKEASKIFTMLMARKLKDKMQNGIEGDVFIENTSKNLAVYGRVINLNLNAKQNKNEIMNSDNAELENEVAKCKQDLVAMEETNSRNSGDSLGGSSFFVSFSDIISVLLCFFILFFTMSKLDGQKNIKLSSTYANQVIKKVTFNAYASKNELEMLEKVKEMMLENVNPDAIIGSETKTIKHVISGKDVFGPGKIKISENGIELLMQKLKNDLTGEVKQVIVEGHTDDQELFAFPENLKTYENNTRLSAARAITVAKIIEEKLNSSSNIIGVRAYGSNRPLKPNTSDLFRALNRRVVIKIKKDREKEIIKDNKKVDDITSFKN
jgi:chemotaxis protein MotB